MSFLVIGDPHFKTNNVEETTLMCQTILSLIDQLSPTFIVVLGDVLDRHETIHVNPLMRATDLLIQCSLKSPTYVLIGNHDRPNNQVFLTGEHPFIGLIGRPNLFLVSQPLIHSHFLFVPYVPPGRFKEAIQGFDLKSVDLIFAHQEFMGAKMGAIVSKIGDEWEEDLPPIISGHIHDFQRIQSNILYVGTPMQHAFGDQEDKGVFLFTPGGNDFGKYSFQKYDLGIPKKKIIRLNCSQVKELLALDNHSHYKIVLSGTPYEIKMLKLSSFIQHLTCPKIVFKTISTKKSSTLSIVSTKGFYEMMIERIKVDPELVKLFQQIC